MNTYSSEEVSDAKQTIPIDFGREFMSQMLNTCGTTSTPNDYYSYEPYVVFGQPFVTTDGYVSLILSEDMRIDISASHSIRVSTSNSIAAINHFGKSVGIIHPFGRVLQEIQSNDCCNIESGIHLAKMSSRGVTFTSLNRSLIYLVDNSGCKTTTERFRKLNYDFTSDIFHLDALSGEYARQRAFADVLRSSYEVSQQGRDQLWQLAGIRIRYKPWGEVLVSKSFGKIMINVSHKKNLLKVVTPNLRVTISDDQEN